MRSLVSGWAGAAVALALAASPSTAQVTTRKAITLEGAKTVVAAAAAEARRLGATGVFAVVDEGGNLMAVERLDGTFAAGANIAIGKARTAVLFKKPTKFFEDVIGKGRTAMATLADFTPLQGGLPLVVDGEVVGGIGVSGASSAQQDEDLATAGAGALAGRDVAPAAVTYIESAKVAAGFAKGMPLLEVPGYKIHASRREGPGQVEVHRKDTDIIYVLSGAATFVTGGTMVDGKDTGPDEVRGASIQGGETRRLVKGDLIVVPSGTPHWFREVSGPMTYYVVKVH
jgi:glc operon protein GlcG